MSSDFIAFLVVLGIVVFFGVLSASVLPPFDRRHTPTSGRPRNTLPDGDLSSALDEKVEAREHGAERQCEVDGCERNAYRCIQFTTMEWETKERSLCPLHAAEVRAVIDESREAVEGEPLPSRCRQAEGQCEVEGCESKGYTSLQFAAMEWETTERGMCLDWVTKERSLCLFHAAEAKAVIDGVREAVGRTEQ